MSLSKPKAPAPKNKLSSSQNVSGVFRRNNNHLFKVNDQVNHSEAHFGAHDALSTKNPNKPLTYNS